MRWYGRMYPGEIDYAEFAALVKKEAWIYELSESEVQLAWAKIDVRCRFIRAFGRARVEGNSPTFGALQYRCARRY
jgi:hypothetical protein